MAKTSLKSMETRGELSATVSAIRNKFLLNKSS